MPPPEPEQGDRRQEGGGGGGGFGSSISGIIRIAVFWYFASKLFSPKGGPATGGGGDPALVTSNLFQKSEPIEVWVYVNSSLVWHQSNIPYGEWGPESTRSASLEYSPSEAVLSRNASLVAEVFVCKAGFPHDPSDPEFSPEASFRVTHPLVTFVPKPKSNSKRSLLDASDDKKDKKDEIPIMDDSDSSAWMPHWRPNLTINLLHDFTTYPRNALPPNIAPFLQVEPESGNYYPMVYFNDFWLLRDKLIPINATTLSAGPLPLNIEVGPISMTKWQLFHQIDQSFSVHASYGSMVDGEADELKRVFLEGNPVLLAVTMLVSLLHSVFDFLAFKNDIQFWNKNKSMEGLSAKSVVVSFVSQLIVFLYLLDNDTSWMILGSAGVGCCIEFWKIGKAMHIQVDRSGRIPMLRFRDRESYSGNKTKEYDDMAMKYLSYVLFLLVGCSALYSLKYERHRSWYSWILSSLTSCVYMFGFIMMCPQLFINYKLKSVAHLPWRQMTYKFLNTIIDDLFAFVIKMPMLHRLSVFRDDIIFLIYVYQRWVYPVDKRRVNEFGFGGEDDDQPTEQLTQATPEEDDKKTN